MQVQLICRWLRPAFAAMALGLVFAGCTTPQQPADPVALTQRIRQLSPAVDPEEADVLATTACDYSWQLAQTYRVVRPARWHNLLVNCGLRSRGLCYHWADDLGTRLAELQLKSIELHYAAAHRGSYLREHNALVITGPGQTFEQGLVLDAWRNSGRLFWTPVAADSYPWRELAERPTAERPHQAAAQPPP